MATPYGRGQTSKVEERGFSGTNAQRIDQPKMKKDMEPTGSQIEGSGESEYRGEDIPGCCETSLLSCLICIGGAFCDPACCPSPHALDSRIVAKEEISKEKEWKTRRQEENEGDASTAGDIVSSR